VDFETENQEILEFSKHRLVRVEAAWTNIFKSTPRTDNLEKLEKY
jgi:hypothetical protein